MGILHVTVSVANSKQDQPPYEADFLVEPGAIDCLAPASSLAAAGIEVEGRDVYELVNGEVVEYPLGCYLIHAEAELEDTRDPR
ncbi:MAG: hypothetical protein ACRD1T_19835 [Acidimicrobiia bacterium]